MTTQEGQQQLNVAKNLKVFQSLDEKERKFNELAQSLANQIFILLRSAGIYDLQNEALQKPYQNTLDMVKSLYQIVKAPIVLRLVDGNFYMNRREIKSDFSTAQNMQYLKKIFEFLEINELQIDPSIDIPALTAFLNVFVVAVKEKKGIKQVVLSKIQLRKLELGKLHPLHLEKDENIQTLTWFMSTLNICQHFIEDAQKKRVPQYAQLKRQFIELIAFSSQSYLYLGAILQLPYEQGTLPRLMIDLAIQSAIWSGRLGSMSDNERLELVMASAQSYIGWALIDAPLEAQSTQFVHQLMHKLQLPEDALSQFRNFVTRALMDLGGMNESMVERSIIAFEANQSFKQSKSLDGHVYSPIIEELGLYQAKLRQNHLSQMVRTCLHLSAERYGRQVLNLNTTLKKEYQMILGVYPIGSMVSAMDGFRGMVVSYPQPLIEVHSLTNHAIKSYDSQQLKLENQTDVDQLLALFFGRLA